MSEIDDIRRQMAQIRHDLHQDVSSVVSGVSEVVSDVTEVMDWQSSLRRHPYVVVGTALVAGYLIVPRRKRPREVVIDRALPLAASAVGQPTVRPAKKFRPLSWALGMIAPLASQAAQAYAMSWIEAKLKEQIHPGPDDGRQQPGPRQGQYPYPAPGRFR